MYWNEHIYRVKVLTTDMQLHMHLTLSFGNHGNHHSHFWHVASASHHWYTKGLYDNKWMTLAQYDIFTSWPMRMRCHTYVLYILRTRSVFLILLYGLTAQCLLHTMSEPLVEKPIQQRVYGAVSMSKQHCEWQNLSVSVRWLKIEAQRSYVVRQPTHKKYSYKGY